MADTDSLLKLLVQHFMSDVAGWLLRTPIHTVRALNVELPTPALSVDHVLHVTPVTGRAGLLHIEFQGRRSHAPMDARMLEYSSRLAVTYRLPLTSVVVYIGRGAGRDDLGEYQVESLTGPPTLRWRYEVIRLWQVSADTLLTMGRPAILTLIGQTQITQPEIVLPQVVRQLRQVADAEQRARLFTTLVALLEDEEWITMVERLLAEDELLFELPYLRRLRTEERTAGREEGREAGREEGREEGRRQEARALLLRLLEGRFGALTEAVRASIEAADRLTLERWSERILHAPTPEAVVAP